MMDDRERDPLKSSTSDPADESEEYEVEPPDPQILAAHERHAQQTMESTRMAIDIDEIYRDVEHDRGREILEGWFRNLPRRFQIKHLLIATAVLAILLTLAKLGLMVIVVIGAMLSIAGVFLYLQWQERKQQEAANQRRQEMYARRRAQLGEAHPAETNAPAVAEPAEQPPEPSPAATNEIDEAFQKARRSREFHFRFTLQQLLAAITGAAILFGLVHLLGGPSPAASLLGLVALLGLVVHALGFEPPEVVVLGWWLILVMYVALSILGALWSGIAQ
jgi:hypothetical protein